MIPLLPINPQVAAEARLVAGADGDGELSRHQTVWPPGRLRGGWVCPPCRTTRKCRFRPLNCRRRSEEFLTVTVFRVLVCMPMTEATPLTVIEVHVAPLSYVPRPFLDQSNLITEVSGSLRGTSDEEYSDTPPEQQHARNREPARPALRLLTGRPFSSHS